MNIGEKPRGETGVKNPRGEVTTRGGIHNTKHRAPIPCNHEVMKGTTSRVVACNVPSLELWVRATSQYGLENQDSHTEDNDLL